jgi:hypothetical protein
MNWLDTLKTLAPTVASALGGPLAGVAVTAIGELLGMSEPTQDKIKAAIENGQLTGEQVAGIRQLELKLTAEEKERGFRYVELEFKDRDSARKFNTEGGIQGKLFALSLMLLALTLGVEATVLFNGIPKSVQDIVAGRVLGLMDSVALMVLAYYYGTSSGSARKTEILNGVAK